MKTRVIFLRIKAALASAALCLLLLAALALLALAAGGQRYGGLMLAAPSQAGTPGFDAEKLEQFCEDEFLVTYEIRQQKTVRALNSNHSATMIGTNACYQSVIGYSMLDGGFFTKAAWNAKSRHVTLNETAAFELFGSRNISGKTLRIGAETWLVTGVMQDGDKDNANIYAPSGATGGSPQSLMALLGGGITEAYAKNALKSLGVHDSAYEFYNLSRLSSLFGERFGVAWKSAVCLLAILVAAGAAGGSFERLRGIKSQLKERYLAELAVNNRAGLVKAAGELLLLLFCAGTALGMSLQILNTCLGWRGLSPPVWRADEFAMRLKWLLDYQYAGIAIFAAAITAAGISFIIACGLSIRKIKTCPEA